MKPIYSICVLIGCLLFASPASAEIRYRDGTTGQARYARVKRVDGTFFAVTLAEGATSQTRNYIASDAAILTASGGSGTLPTGTLDVQIRSGSASATTDDPLLGGCTLPWSGSAEIVQTQTGDSYSLLTNVTYGLNALLTAIGNVSSGGGSSTDFNDEAIPPARLFKLVEGDDDDEGLVGEQPRKIKVGTTVTFGIDFAIDMATNDRVYTVAAPSVVTVDGEDEFVEGGLTFGTRGREDSQAKVPVTAVTAGEYEVDVQVTYASGSTRTGRVTFIAYD